MAAKKSSNSNKTAHVMNLLSRNREPAPQEEAEQKPADAQTASPASPQAAPSQVSSLMSSLHPDAAVSAQIKSALEADLAEEDSPPPQPAPAELPPQAETPSIPAEEAALVDLAAPAEEALSNLNEDTAAQQAITQGLEELEAQETAAAQPSPQVPQNPPPQQEASTEIIQFDDPNASVPYGELVYVNIMQQLVEETAPKYMRLYGVCRCPRCQVDVKALALSGLPSKYVVMRKGEMVPRISVYEGRYSAAVTAQLLWACKLVTEKPHHGR